MWSEVMKVFEKLAPKNVKLVPDPKYGYVLRGNDGTILTMNPHVAMGYVNNDWDSINMKAGK